jgi:hypothetical protein
LKPIVTVLKQDLESHPEMLLPLREFCDHVEEDVDSFAFYPKAKSSMNLLCLLLDQEIMYKLGFENTVDKQSAGDPPGFLKS